MLKKILTGISLLIVTGTILMGTTRENNLKKINVIPLPKKIEYGKGYFELTKNTKIIGESDSRDVKNLFQEIMEKDNFLMGINNSSKNEILFSISGELKLPEEHYILEVSENKCSLIAGSVSGLLNGMQTFRQIIWSSEKKDGKILVPALRIEDGPTFKWRGLMLDVSRHFFPKTFLLKLIDIMSLHKINKFHIHLVDDHGWRIEIKKYPLLTELGAWRVDREHLNWNERPDQKEGEKATYGGFYTQKEIKEIIDYAARRNVEIIPEIEMPAHVVSALAAYPELSCTGEKLSVKPGAYWPNTDIYCAGKEKTFEFLQNVLDEIIALFPSKYIHIGGDEADKFNWEKCPDCQKRVVAEGLKDTKELQSYFIKRIGKYLKSKNKNMIGWDEIIEGGLAENATVMSWRGIEGGIEAARTGNEVIMSPTSHCYIDYYQGEMENEPLAIGGYLPLSKVYSFNPVPDVLNKEESSRILGAQINLWTEYVPTESHAEYMILPRLAALSEVGWTQYADKNFQDFIARLESLKKIYDKNSYNYSRSSYNVIMKTYPDSTEKGIKIILENEIPGSKIYFTTDGSEPTTGSNLFDKQFLIEKNTTIRARTFMNEKPAGNIFEKEIKLHSALYKKYTLKNPSVKYHGSGDYSLTNGLAGSKNYADGKWVGFEGNDVELILDLEKIDFIKQITTSFLQDTGAWIFLPEYVEYFISEDGSFFKSVDKNIITEKNSKDIVVNTSLVNDRARYIKIVAKNIGVCPPGHSGNGEKAWLFTDEIIVE